MAKYTYTIFDANPNSCGGTEWPSHDGVEIEADSDQEASEEVYDVMSAESGRCNPVDGYEVGDRLYSLVWDETGRIIGDPTYTLTAEDLGVDESSESDSEEEEASMDQPSARERFYQAARDAGSDPVSEENAILSVGRELLPPCAIVVLDGGEATDEYWDWLRSQTEQAQAEQDAEIAAGHEWHE